MMYNSLRPVLQSRTPEDLLKNLANLLHHEHAALLSLRRYAIDVNGNPVLAPEAFWRRDDIAFFNRIIRLEEDSEALNWIQSSGEPLFIDDIDNFTLFTNSAIEFYKQQKIRSLYRVLLRRGDNIVAMLSVMWQENLTLSDEYKAQIECLSWVLAPVLESLYIDEEKERLSVTVKELEKKLRDAEMELHSLAHDLKQPITAIMLTADTLNTYLDRITPEKATIMLKRITDATLGMSDWITSILLMAQVKSANEITLQPLDMLLLVNHVVESLEELFKKHDAKIILDSSLTASLIVEGESTWIAHIWANLISNACKYGGSPPAITLAAIDLGDRIQFRIQDNGQGIPPEKLDLVFEPFMRLDKHKPRLSGTGIGLTTVNLWKSYMERSV